MRTHKDLQVWQKAIDLAKRVDAITSLFPRRKAYGLAAQMRKTAVSIPSNIAEGAARNSRKDFVRFLYISLGSVAELETQWALACELGYARPHELDSHINQIRKMLIGLIRQVEAPSS